MQTYLTDVAEFYRTKGARDERPRKRRGQGDSGSGLKKSAWIGLLGVGGVGAGLLAGKGKALLKGSTKNKLLKEIAKLDKDALTFAKKYKAKGRKQMSIDDALKSTGTYKKKKQLTGELGEATLKDKEISRNEMKKMATRLGIAGAGAGIVTKPFFQGKSKRQEPQYRYIPREYLPMPYYYYSAYQKEVAEFARTRGAKDKKKRKSRKDMTRKELLQEDEKLKYAAGRGAKAGALGGGALGALSGATSGALQGAVLGSAGGPGGAAGGAALGGAGGALVGGGVGALAGAPGGAINAAWAKKMEKRYRKKLLKGKDKKAA